jgi:hypothetical protein
VFGRRPTFDRLRNRRFGTVLFDPHDEYFILPTKATELAAFPLSRVLRHSTMPVVRKILAGERKINHATARMAVSGL